MNKNKVEFGLSNVHIMFEKETGWDAPKAMPGAVTFSPELKTDETTFCADDIAYYSDVSGSTITGDLTMALFPEWFLAGALGAKTTEKGGIFFPTDSIKKRFCIWFEGKGDKNKVRRVFLSASAGPVKEEYKTLEDKKDIKTQVVPITVIGLPVGTGGTMVTNFNAYEGDPLYTALETGLPDFKSLVLTDIAGV